MKKHLFFTLATLVAVLFSSCKDNGNDDDPNGPWGVELTAQYAKVFTGNSSGNNEFYVEIAGTGTVTIDWGDGTMLKDLQMPTRKYIEDDNVYEGKRFTHIYNQVGTYSVKITGKDGAITLLSCTNGDEEDNHYSAIQLNRCSQLKDFTIWGNMTSLDVSKCTQLESLECWLNQLTSLDVSKNMQLKKLYCYENQLTSLDISKNAQLKRLECDDNQLTSLDVSQCTQLESLMCSDNKLSALDASKCAQLKDLNCRGNQLSATAMNKIYNDLPSWPDNDKGSLDVDEATAGNYSIAENKGWSVHLSYQ